MRTENNLGKKAKDKVTGFTGIITSYHVYLTGCLQYGIQPEVNSDNKVPDKSYFDDGRIEILGDGITKDKVTSNEKGCDSREHPNKS